MVNSAGSGLSVTTSFDPRLAQPVVVAVPAKLLMMLGTVEPHVLLESGDEKLVRHTSALRGPQQPVNSYVWHRARGLGAIVIDPEVDLAQMPAAEVLVTHVQEENVAGWKNISGARVHLPEGDDYLAAGPEALAKLIQKWQPPWEWETRGN